MVMHRRGTSVAKLVVVLWVLIGLGVAAQDESCSTSRLADDIYNDVINSIAFDTESLKWTATPGPGAARVRLDSSAKMREVLGPLLRNRRLLFLGDSTARNPAVVLMTMMCNDHFDQRYQRLGWNRNDSLESINCNSDVPGNDYTCASDVSVWEVPIAGITTNATPTSRAARKAMWLSGEVPPMIRTVSRRFNFSIDSLEAGCGSKDHLVSVLHKYMNATVQALHRDQPRVVFGDGSGDYRRFLGSRVVEQYDGVVVAGGMHCNYERFWSGWWYKTLSRLLRYVAPQRPVVFIEMPHCLKRNKRVSPRALVDCPFVSTAVGDIRAVLTSVPGVFIAPTRNFTANQSLMRSTFTRLTLQDRQQSHCPVTDFIHPSVSCYMSIAASAVMTLDRAIKGLLAETVARRDLCSVNDGLPDLRSLMVNNFATNVPTSGAPIVTVASDVPSSSDMPEPLRHHTAHQGAGAQLLNDSEGFPTQQSIRTLSHRSNDLADGVTVGAIFVFIVAVVILRRRGSRKSETARGEE